MTDIMGFSPSLLLVLVVGVACTAMICRTILAGWRDWISLKHAEIAAATAAPATARAGQGEAGHGGEGDVSTASRIELADMRERLRKLEAIAAGVDL